MNCYTCDGLVLKPVRLAADLPARQCSKCGGVHLDLLAYRTWLEKHPGAAEDPATAQEEIPQAMEHGRVRTCGRCSRLMLRYRVTVDKPNFIDLCASCDDVWLDQGEWELLRRLHVHDLLTEIIAEPWQRRLRQVSEKKLAESRYVESLGEEEFARVRELALWINEHPQREDVLRYLREHVDGI